MIKDNNLISLNLISNDGNIHLTIFVNPNISCATLMTIMSEEIKKIYPDFSPEKHIFLHAGKNLVFNARKLSSENFKNGDCILICKIKEDHVIKDMSFQLVNLVEVISINLVSHDHSYYYKLMVEEDKTSTELISILTKRILKQFPDKSKNEFYFIYKGKKLNLSNRTLQDLGIKNGETFFAYEIKPLLDENLELEVSVIMDQSNTHEINFDFKLKGLLKFCLIKDMSLIINSDIFRYRLLYN